MHIGFDNDSRLCRDIYYFEYKGVRYKLIQNNYRRYSDVLITVIPLGDRLKECHVYNIASEFLSALSWENNAKIMLCNLGGPGGAGTFTLRKAKCHMFNPPQIAHYGNKIGYDISVIPEIETDAQRYALALFRNANSSNNIYLSFLFFWNVLETGNDEAIGWVNKAFKKNRDKIRLLNGQINCLPLRGKKLGNYLYEDCRNAISHIRREPGRIKLKIDTLNDYARIVNSTFVIKEFARFYIHERLGLRKKMYLVRKSEKNFPIFVNDSTLKKHNYTFAYKRLEWPRIRKKYLPFH